MLFSTKAIWFLKPPLVAHHLSTSLPLISLFLNNFPLEATLGERNSMGQEAENQARPRAVEVNRRQREDLAAPYRKLQL